MSSKRSKPSNRSNRSKDAGVQRSYASQYQEHDALFSSYEHLSGLPRASDALQMLRKIASLVKPIMRKRGWKVQILAEFLPSEQNLLGLNINKGYKICLRLRYHNHPDLFLPLEQVVDTALHELSHIIWGDHDSNFHRLWDELRDEHETLVRKGYTGEGFLSHGQRLGGSNFGRSMPPQQEMRRLAQESAEKRKKQGTLAAGSGRRLSGAPLHLMGRDIRSVIADQVDRRNTINRGCGSGRADAGQLSQQPDNQVFKTKAEEDDANDRAIALAIYELMEEEEDRKLQSGLAKAPDGRGLAWSKESGLYDPTSQPSSSSAIPAAVGAEDQMKWAIERSLRETSAQVESKPSSISPKAIRPIRPKENQAAGRKRPPTISPVENPDQPLRTKSTVSSDSSAIEIDSDMWTCEICTLINPMKYLACDACGVERPFDQSRSTASSRLSSKAKPKSGGAITGQRARSTASSLAAVIPAPQKPGLGWNCICGAFMEHQWWTCSACGRMKEVS